MIECYKQFHSPGLDVVTSWDWIKTVAIDHSMPHTLTAVFGPVWMHIHISQMSTVLARIEYLSFHCITVYSVHGIWSLMPCISYWLSISNWINVCWVGLGELILSLEILFDVTATKYILLWSQIKQGEMQEGIRLHITCIDYVTIQ
jgi:hypothetical protein